MRDVRAKAKKAGILDVMGDWTWRHPLWTVAVIVAIDLCFFWLLVSLYGCASQPPRFENGDPTASGPKTYGDVDEPDMAHPSIFH